MSFCDIEPLPSASALRVTDLATVNDGVWAMGVVVEELFEVTTGPLGAVAVADAVLITDPVFTSLWVMVRVAVQVAEAPGASVADGQLIADKPGNGSATLSPVNVTLPLLNTLNPNVCMSPNDAPVGAVSVVIFADLVSNNDWVWVIGVVVDDGAEVTAEPDGGVPVAVAVFVTRPAFMSDWVMVRVAVHAVVAPGARVADGHETADRPANGSLTRTAVRVTLPVLVMANENVWVSPKDGPVGAVSVVMATVLDRVIVLVWLIGAVADELFDVTAGPVGGVPEAEAVLMIDPALTSAWVMVRVAVQVVVAPGAMVGDGQLIADRPPSGSEMAIPVRVTLPVFVTANE